MFDWIDGLAQTIAQFINGTFGPAADFMEHYVWLWPKQAPLLAVILVGTGLFVTLRLGFVQVRGFKHAVAITNYDGFTVPVRVFRQPLYVHRAGQAARQ